MRYRSFKPAVVMGVLVLLAARVTRAEDTPRYVFWGFDGGFSWALGEGSDLWKPGTAFGINFLYPLDAHLAIGARLGFNRWALDNDHAAEALLPPGATPLASESDGNFKILEITPLIRATSGKLLFGRIAAFAQVDGGLYYVSFNAESIVEYRLNAQSQTVTVSTSGSDNRGGVGLGAGLSMTFSKDSHLELYPAYNIVFEPDGTTEFVNLLVAFRVEFSPWDGE